MPPTRRALPLLGLIVLAACGVPAAAAFDGDGADGSADTGGYTTTAAPTTTVASSTTGAPTTSAASTTLAPTTTAGSTTTAASTTTDAPTTTGSTTTMPGGATSTTQPRGATTTAAPTTLPSRKVFVCKFVGTPGVDERLQTGQNPISVSVNAIPLENVRVGSEFADRQGRSLVIAFDVGQPEPDRSECLGGTTTTTSSTTTTTSSTTTTTQPETTTTSTTTTTEPETTTSSSTTTTQPETTTTSSTTTTEPETTTTSSTTTTQPDTTTSSSSTTSSTSTSTTSTTSSTSTSTTSTTQPAPPTPGLFGVTVLGSSCTADVPYIDISFGSRTDLDGRVGNLEFFDLNGRSIDTRSLTYEANTTVRVVYPGATVDAQGNPTDWPGWVFTDGLWVPDDSDAAWRDGLRLVYTIGVESANAQVTYPPETAACSASPPVGAVPSGVTTTTVPAPTTTLGTATTIPGGVTTTTVPTMANIPPAPGAPLPPSALPPGAPGPTTLPTTGSDAGDIAALAVLAALAGGALLLIARRSREA